MIVRKAKSRIAYRVLLLFPHLFTGVRGSVYADADAESRSRSIMMNRIFHFIEIRYALIS